MSSKFNNGTGSLKRPTWCKKTLGPPMPWPDFPPPEILVAAHWPYTLPAGEDADLTRLLQLTATAPGGPWSTAASTDLPHFHCTCTIDTATQTITVHLELWLDWLGPYIADFMPIHYDDPTRIATGRIWIAPGPQYNMPSIQVSS